MLGNSAGIPQRGPVSWRLAALLALMLLPLLTACTGRDIGGVGTGWNPPVSEGEVVYVGTKEGQVKSYIDHGFEGVRPNWTFPTGDGSIDLEGVYTTPLIVGGLLYVAAQDGFMYALDKESGTISQRGWRRPQGEPPNRQPFVGGPAYDPVTRLIVVGSEDGRLYGYDAESGAPAAWGSFVTGDKIWSTPVIRDSVAYFGSHDHKVYAVSLGTGDEIWSYTTGGVVAGRPLLLGDMVIAGSFDKKLYALDASDGRMLWEFEAENWFWAGAVSNGQTIFAPSMDGHIYALDRNGGLEWKHHVGSSIVAPPVLVPRGLVVAAKIGKLMLLDVRTNAANRELFILTLGDAEIKAPMWVAGESIYVGSQDSSLRRVEIKGGQVVMWCTHTKEGQCN